MRVLLDTHTLVWALSDPSELSPRGREILQDLTNTVFVSPASAYEVIQKHRKGAWPEIADLAADFGSAIERAGFLELPITINDMTLAAQFPDQHKDPWDRLLAAQSILSGMPLLSEDKLIDVFRPNRIWA